MNVALFPAARALRPLAWAGALALLAACGAPAAPVGQAQPTMTVTPPPATITATPTLTAVPTATAAPTATHTATPTPAPSVTTTETAAPTPPPTATPLSALPAATLAAQFAAGPPALVYTAPDRMLVAHIEGHDPLWLTADPACGRSTSALAQSGQWSADGRFLAITCQFDGPAREQTEIGVVAIFDTQTGHLVPLPIAKPAAQVRVEMTMYGWSPPQSTLLVALTENWPGPPEGPSQITYHWFRVDVAAGTAAPLPALDGIEGYSASAAWSPDGAALAVRGRDQKQSDQLRVLDREGHLLYSARAPLGYAPPAWSADSRRLTISQRGYTDASSPLPALVLDVDVAAGRATVRTAPAAPPLPGIVMPSPDGQWYLGTPRVGSPDRPSQWQLYHADGRLAHTFVDDPQRSVTAAAWLPDSAGVVLAIDHAGLGVEIVRSALDGVERGIAVYASAVPSGLAVSPDGQRIAVELSGFRIEVLDLAGGKLAGFDGDLVGWRPLAAR